MSKFDDALAVILTHEGGYVNHPQDPGGATNKGITQGTYNAWRRKKKLAVRSVRDIENHEVAAIYRESYWNPLKCEDFPFGVALCLFDFGVNAGISRAAKTLQSCAGVKADGVIGPQTIAAAQAIHKNELIERFTTKRVTYYASLKTFATFGNGWIRRTIETMATAILYRAD